MKNADTLIAVISDMHSGSNRALFVNRFWEGKNEINHTPTSKQQLIRSKWEEYIQSVNESRKGRRLVVVHNGDAIEGVHHRSVDVCTHDLDDQAGIHEELILEFKKGVDWKRGDELYYVLGTETHTLDIEHEIAKKVGGHQFDDGSYATNHLSLAINGRELWFVHKGKNAGVGPNEGNAIRNWTRDIYFQALKHHKPVPDIIYSGHVHNPTYTTYVANEEMKFRTIHGIILPSWQTKTRFAYGVAPVSYNIIGGVHQTITASGDIREPIFKTCETDSMTRA